MALSRKKKFLGAVAIGAVTVVAIVGSPSGSDDSEPKLVQDPSGRLSPEAYTIIQNGYKGD